jgi:rhamnogalacturonan endolyase
MVNSQINIFLMILASSLLLFNTETNAQRQMEYLDRGLLAINIDDGKVFLSWRLLGTDPQNISFNIYRDSVLLNAKPISKSTNFIDNKGNSYSHYMVSTVINGREEKSSSPVKVWPQNHLSISLQTPEGCRPNDASVGDLDGDGIYEIVLHQAPRGRDNSRSGLTDPPILESYKLDGTFMWRINLGPNIREGAHYTQFMVYDLDGDGKAEIACKTADGTIDGSGKVIGDPDTVHQYPEGTTIKVRNRSGKSVDRKMDGYIL